MILNLAKYQKYIFHRSEKKTNKLIRHSKILMLYVPDYIENEKRLSQTIHPLLNLSLVIVTLLDTFFKSLTFFSSQNFFSFPSVYSPQVIKLKNSHFSLLLRFPVHDSFNGFSSLRCYLSTCISECVY